jgi:hypothetical protein
MAHYIKPNEYQNFTINLFINQHNIRKNNASSSPGSRTEETETECKTYKYRKMQQKDIVLNI